jgi:hypothetical protein
MDAEMHIFPDRVSALLTGRGISAFDPDTQGGDYSNLMPVQLATEFSRCRSENLPLITGVTPQDLECSGVHSELGRVTLGQLLNEWAAHDLMHTVQAERALMQTFIPNTGPWRIYFSDHDLGLPAPE